MRCYSDEELKEFESIILAKLEVARKEFSFMRSTLDGSASNDISSALPSANILEEGADSIEKENLSRLATRQLRFIRQLKEALVRVRNGTYGVCVETGELISKERLRTVPHTTHSIGAKQNRED